MPTGPCDAAPGVVESTGSRGVGATPLDRFAIDAVEAFFVCEHRIYNKCVAACVCLHSECVCLCLCAVGVLSLCGCLLLRKRLVHVREFVLLERAYPCRVRHTHVQHRHQLLQIRKI